MRNGLAQSCTGSAGDPIVNITFGAGKDVIAPPLADGTTNLDYYNNSCPDNGQYTITNQTNSCFNNSWHIVQQDHTGDTGGYFMLINASVKPSDFYVQTIDDLCAGTNFKFSAWILNMCNFQSATPPRVVMTIEKTDGSILAKYSTGDIAVNISIPIWKQYGFNFTMPAGVSTVVLRMHNDAPGGIGNDLALDDITFQPIGSKVSVTADGFTGDSLLLCEKDNRNITFHSSVEKCYLTTGYQWQVSTDQGISWKDIAGANSADYTRTPTAAGIYLYRLSVAQLESISAINCRVVSGRFKVIVYQENARTISISKPDGISCEGTPVTFSASTSYAGNQPSFQWMLNNKPVANATDSVFTFKSLSSDDQVNCYFKSSFVCNSDPLLSNTVQVAVLSKARSTINAAICEGENYEGYTKAGIYTDAFPGSNGCDSIRTLNLVVYPKQYSSFDTSICFGTSYLGFKQSGDYTSVYQSVHGCDSFHTIHLVVLPDINAKPRYDTLLCSGAVISFSPGIYDSYRWQDGYTGSTYSIRRGGDYKVTVGNKCGLAVKTIAVDEQVCVVNFPSAFTPNADGRNDLFRPVNAYNIGTFHLALFNRWGQKVFESVDPQKGWDGTLGGKYGGTGVYYWFCTYTDRSKPEEKRSLKGSVVLIR